MVEKIKHNGNVRRFELLFFASIGAYVLWFSAIKHCGRIYENGQSSLPIEKTNTDGGIIEIITQILLGKRNGGRVVTKRTIVFEHQIGKDQTIRSSQKVGVNKKITLTDGTTAEGE